MEVKLANIEINDINLDKNGITAMMEQVFSVEDEIKTMVKENLSPVKQSAYKYISKLQQLLQKVYRLNKLYENRQRLTNLILKGSEQAWNYAKNTNQINNIDIRNILKQATILTDEFTIEIQSFLNKEMELIYIYQNAAGDAVQAYKINNIADIISLQRDKDIINVRLTASKQHLNEIGSLIKNEEYSIGEEQAKKLDKVFHEVISRYNKYRYNRKSLILWNMKSRPKWHGMFLTNRGDLAQAYANFVLAKTGNIFQGNVNNPPEKDIEIFMQAVESVDAAFGGLQGDIEYIKNGMYKSAAIKSLKASPQSITETIILAKSILTTQMDEKQFLEKYKKKWERSGRNKIERFSQTRMKQILKDQFNTKNFKTI